MKGYKLDKTLYIFDATPDAIPVSVDDVDVIYVQQELLAAYVNANQDAASKIKPYNYKLIAVNKLPWADYVDNDLDSGDTPTEYTVNVNFGQTLLKYMPEGLPFEPSIPYTATEGTHLDFTLSFTYWHDLAPQEWNTYRHKLQVTPPESIQSSFNIEYPNIEVNDNEQTVNDGHLTFDMPAEDVTLTVDLIDNDNWSGDYITLNVNNSLPNNYSLVLKHLYDTPEPEQIDDISNVVVPRESQIYVYVYDENNNLVNVSPTDSADYDTSHADAQAMVDYHAYCTIGVDETNTAGLRTLESYYIYNAAEGAEDFGLGEIFGLYTDNTTLTVEVPTVNS